MIKVKLLSEEKDKKIYALSDENSILGKATTKENTLLSVEVIDDKRAPFYRDFLSRSVLFILSNHYEDIKIAYFDDYFTGFGFKQKGDGMEVKTLFLNFDNCPCNKH